MNQAFNDFLSSIGGGLSGDGGPNMKSYQHATKLYVEGGYARAPKFNHLYFVAFNINDGVVRDRSWLQNGYNTVGLLVKSTSLPKFKIAAEQMNQYNRKTQVQTKLTYEPVTMEFHDDNSEITNGLWKNYYRYYYTDSIYGGKDDTVTPTPSQVSLGKKLFGGLLSPGNKRIKARENNAFPDAYTDNKYKKNTYPYGLDNFQSLPFFKSIDIFVLHQQKFTQITLINPKITSWDHDDVGQSDSTKLMRNKMSLVYENVLYNDGRIGKGSRSGIFAEAFYDTSPSPLSIAGKGSASLFGPGGLIGGVEDIFGENGALAQGDYLAAALQAATLIKNAGQISEQQLSAEGYSMLGAAVGIAVSSRNGEIGQNLENYFGNGIGVYTNQYSKNNLEDINTSPYALTPDQYRKFLIDQEAAAYAQEVADTKARQAQQAQENINQTQIAINNNDKLSAAITQQIESNSKQQAELAQTVRTWESLQGDPYDETQLRSRKVYLEAKYSGLSDEEAINLSFKDTIASNARAQAVIDAATISKASIAAYAELLQFHKTGIEQNTESLYKYGIAYATRATQQAVDYVDEYGSPLAYDLNNGENPDQNPYRNYLIAELAYKNALKTGSIVSVDQANTILQAAISANVGEIVQENAAYSAQRTAETARSNVLYDQVVEINAAREKRLEVYTQLLNTVNSLGLDQDGVNNLRKFAEVVGVNNDPSITSKLDVAQAYLDEVKAVSQSQSQFEKLSSDNIKGLILYSFIETYDSGSEFSKSIKGLETQEDFNAKYLNTTQTYIDSEGVTRTKLYDASGIYLEKYLPALEYAEALSAKIQRQFEDKNLILEEKARVIYKSYLTEANDEIARAFGNRYRDSIILSGTLNQQAATAVGNATALSAKITANTLLLNRVTIVNTDIGSASTLLQKELSYNPSPNKPYVILTDSRTVDQIAEDNNPGKPLSGTATVTNVRTSADDARYLAIQALKVKLTEKIYGNSIDFDGTVLDGQTVNVTETKDKKGNSIWTATITASTIPPAPLVTTSVIVTYVDPRGKVQTSSIVYGKNNDYLTQAQAAAAQLEYYKSKNIKVLGVVVNTKNSNNTSNNRYSSK